MSVRPPHGLPILRHAVWCSGVKSFEFVLVVGGGLEFGPISVEARWREGLVNLDKEATTDGMVLNSRTFLFLGGVRF
jgi:hypothetical protein